MRIHHLAALLLVAGCAAKTSPPQSAGGKPADMVSIPSDPWPSTYRAWPSVTTVIRNATVYDGAGRQFSPGAVRIENGVSPRSAPM
jgi:hypothetical protein